MPNPKKPEPNPIEEAIGDRAKPQEKLSQADLQKVAQDIKKEAIRRGATEKPNYEMTPDEPSPSEMLTLEELNRQTEERLRDDSPLTERECLQQTVEIPKIVTPKSPIPVSKPDPQPVTKTFSPESPPQKIDMEFHPVAEPIPGIDKLPPDFKVEHTYDTGIAGAKPVESVIEKEFSEKTIQAPIVNNPAEDVELTALRKYILEDGFVLATVAFHIVTLCAQPMVTPSTTTWDFRDRASVPDMVLALLNQPGYIEGIWPSLAVVMGSNKGNAAWCAGIATTIAFFDVVRTLPAIKELQIDVDK